MFYSLFSAEIERVLKLLSESAPSIDYFVVRVEPLFCWWCSGPIVYLLYYIVTFSESLLLPK